MSSPLDYLTTEKKELLKTDWLSNTFVRYKIINTNNSFTEAILRVFQRGEYRRSYQELETFYKQISDDLASESKYTSKEIYLNIFQNEELKDYTKKKGIVLVKSNLETIKNLTFYFKDAPETRFYFFPATIRNLKDNCKLIQYLSGIDIKLPYNYFKVRFLEKNNYLDIVTNVEKIKQEPSQSLCDETVEIIKEKKILNNYLGFSNNLFSRGLKKDFKFYLFLYPKIFNINLIIYTPFKDDKIIIENIIEEDESYPYLILCQPLREKSLDLKIELGALMIDRRIVFMLDPKKHRTIIETIKDRYNTSDNNLPIIEYLKSLKDRKYSRYLKDYDLEKINEDVYELLEKLKYYNYEL